MEPDLDKALAEIRKRDPRYEADAYRFIFESLEYTLGQLGERRHLGGKELAEGIRQLAVKQFGSLAKMVFHRWGVKATDDFGEIVFNLIDAELLRKRPADRKEDFHAVYDFATAFHEKAGVPAAKAKPAEPPAG